MPIITIPLAELGERLGRPVARAEIEPLLDQLGCDVEDFTEILRHTCRDCGLLIELQLNESLPAACPECGATRATPEELWRERGRVPVVRMDALPVRPDLFDSGGLARALRGLLGQETGLPHYECAPAHFTVHVDPALARPESYRPFIRCAVVRGLELDDVGLRQVMKLQELLHWALGRDRKLASIGVYSCADLAPRITYRAVAPDELEFVPLQSVDGRALTPRKILAEHPKGTAYAHLLAAQERYPLLQDERGRVLSLPPIINSEETRLTAGHHDVFIDVTGVSERAVDKALNTLTTSLLESFPGARLEKVTIRREDGPEETRVSETPDLRPQKMSLETAAAERLIGVTLTPDEAARHLARMRHDCRLEGGALRVQVAPYRNDCMHEVDLIEDVAMAYGYDNIAPRLVQSMTIGRPRPERVLARRARAALIGHGYFEVMTLLLSNEATQYDLLGQENPGTAVQVAHPISTDQTLMRASLIPGLLKLFALNRGQGLPQRLFEVDDVVLMPRDEHEPREELHLAAGILAKEAGFADVRALAASIGRELGMELTFAPVEAAGYLPGRVATLNHEGREVGRCGEIHPEVLEKLRLITPLAVLEIDLEHLI